MIRLPLLAAAVIVAGSQTALAAGCDLDRVVGYQLAFARTIEGYIDNDKRHLGFEGCEPGRILLFTDNTGVRCKSAGRQHAELPKAYLFAHSQYDLKLCVVDTFYDVAPLR